MMLLATGNGSILKKPTEQSELTSETREAMTSAMPRCEINYDFDPKGESVMTVAFATWS